MHLLHMKAMKSSLFLGGQQSNKKSHGDRRLGREIYFIQGYRETKIRGSGAPNLLEG